MLIWNLFHFRIHESENRRKRREKSLFFQDRQAIAELIYVYLLYKGFENIIGGKVQKKLVRREEAKMGESMYLLPLRLNNGRKEMSRFQKQFRIQMKVEEECQLEMASSLGFQSRTWPRQQNNWLNIMIVVGHQQYNNSNYIINIMIQEPSSLEGLEQFDYVEKLGNYHPHFRSALGDYEPPTKKGFALFFILCILVTLMFTGLTVGLVEWVIAYGSESFAISWSILGCVFFFAFIVLSYTKSKSHIRVEEKLIRKKIKEQKQQIIKEFLERAKLDYQQPIMRKKSQKFY